MPLRQKLVLLFSAFTLSVLAVAGAFAYGDVRTAAHLAAAERLSRVVEQLTSLAAATTQERLALKESLSDDPALRAVLRGRPVDSAAVAEALAVLRTPSDSGLPVQLWNAAGQPVFSDRPSEATLSAADAPLDSVPTYGHFRARGDEMRYWSTAPVRAEDGRILGWAVQERRIGDPAMARRLERLIGSDSRIVYAIPGDSVAVTLAGEGIPPPPSGLPTDTLLTYQRDGRAFFARAGGVPASPWVVLVEMPASAVEARPETFFRRMVVFGLLLLGVAVAAAWLLGRRFTRPIEELVAASEAMAGGDYTGTVSASGRSEELDRLAEAFNTMARRVDRSHRELKRRLREEQKLSRQLEEAREKAVEARRAAEEANRAKSDFLATMSHEIRTPINAVLGYCDLLDMEIGGSLSEKQRRHVERIRRSSRMLEMLVEDLLDFSHLEAGQLRIEARSASVRDAAEAAVSTLVPRADEKGLYLKTDVPEELRFAGDPDRVEQILMNLLSNAVKFTDEGGVTVRARDGRSPEPAGESPPTDDGGWIRIEVRDTGPGIREEEKERIFEPFVQGDMSLTRRHGGTGLGLSIGRKLARMMGGDLTVRGDEDGGACFTLWLPSAPVTQPS